MTNTPPTGATQGATGQSDKANGTTMVTVGCKLPNGLVCEMGTLGDENHTTVRLNGTNSARVIGGYGMTQVSQDFWQAWMKKNGKLEFVRKGFVFVHGDLASAQSHASEQAGRLNGFEAINASKPILGPDGKPLLETDMDHFMQGQQDVAQFGGGRAAAR